ncbi:NAD(P)-dependent oxidoreductase [Mesorhizobium sp. M1C.F.Ca.ET.193.01.1.1]|uniref:NAD(P)-dependent oxidoreductase n=1 Tax=unclassified Mesorhizobium TaxID=325217 RepID=UPI000FD35ADC|nr:MULTISPECIES: NAD(P)-dependent oxidoreductase [unclassified Mesorhizobium]TGT02293.1 NAD(P)-dependent oxidoreductase [bacterium M00.F.Ca.ET.177.01.1.1]TGQ54544.1 NAD(P)-dependent oxidoreductase [Mesorhizobium sp. M1C.F.Ca.ET.210.01.1.1]TGQ72539.1 NAD(P)-dependent oxidoreductase [Mesorhizobium sp. M1C.F.Ca.ET.212.01.1.1]TGR10336.1 NAD(P)-dependent oxidoreductase [Mesorhizobium sp. M1C.F.Ca.ET.204.01.1.1]TGR30938.1 NAD(P)-dependent oxidoreductase [Mesorhizobium sp. M1C.F.Ca.ET.196.01.1.1]
MTRLAYAFIGLGHLGGNLAASLVRNGFAVTVFDRDPAAIEHLVALGATAAASPAEAAARAGNAITCLPSPKVSETVLAGPDGLLDGLPIGGTWIEMSTNGRDEILRLSALTAAKGIDTLECPVTGGVHLAAAGKITALVGGEAALYERHRPAIEAMCAKSFLMGPLGSAAVMKVITNMLAFIHLVAAGEALMLARQGGLDLAQAYHAIVASSGNSFVHETESQLVLNGSYDIGFTMDLALKDLGFALRMGRDFGVPLDLVARVNAIFEQGKEAYGGDAWSTQIVKLLEDAVGTELRAPGFPARLEL